VIIHSVQTLRHTATPMVKILAAAAVSALLLDGSSGARVRRRNQLKNIAGVPVYNFDQAFKRSRWHESFLQVVDSMETDTEQWMVMMKPGVTQSNMDLACSMHPQCEFRGHSEGVPFLELRATEFELTQFLQDEKDNVEMVEPNLPIEAIPEVPANQADVPWGLRRVRTRSLNSMPVSDPGPAGGGAGVNAYVLDTGVRTTHVEFEGRAIPTLQVDVLGVTAKECKADETDCAGDGQGHGTHCAGTIGGKSFGVAKGVTIRAVKVLMDNGAGSAFSILRGMDWVGRKHQKPAIASMSLGGGSSWLLNSAADIMVNRGVIVVTASGNSNADGCWFSPGGASNVINVGATDPDDARSSFSNYGKCLDIFAPGRDVLSAVHTSDTDSKTYSGTSMACPHVSGAVAILLQGSPELTAEQIKGLLTESATKDVVTDAQDESPNLLLYSAP